MVPRKFKEYSIDLRNLVIKHFWNGFFDKNIAHKVLIPRKHLFIIYFSSTNPQNVLEILLVVVEKEKQQLMLIVSYGEDHGQLSDFINKNQS